MPRRVSLPSADDLFRPTEDETGNAARTRQAHQAASAAAVTRRPGPARGGRGARAGRRTSGRVRHDEKMTVYVTSEELLELEHARLTLRSAHGLAVDRGRLVREAISLVLADLEANGGRERAGAAVDRGMTLTATERAAPGGR